MSGMIPNISKVRAWHHIYTCCLKHKTASSELLSYSGRNGKTIGGGVHHQYFGRGFSMRNKNWTQSYLRFCENDGSKRSKINEKVGQFD